MNRVILKACLIGKEPLRYTLNGVAICSCKLAYEGQVKEAGILRKLKFSTECVALGSIAEQLNQEELGSDLSITGFLVPSSPRTSKLVVHITEYKKGV